MTTWGVAKWNENRWAAFKPHQLINIKPKLEGAWPIGVDDWKLKVEAMLPRDQNSMWGVGTWKEDYPPEGGGIAADAFINPIFSEYLEDEYGYASDDKLVGEALQAFHGSSSNGFNDWWFCPPMSLAGLGVTDEETFTLSFWLYNPSGPINVEFSTLYENSSEVFTLANPIAYTLETGWSWIVLNFVTPTSVDWTYFGIYFSDWRPGFFFLYMTDFYLNIEEDASAVWNSLSWHDITSDVRGLDISRGADEYLGPPRIGELVLTLDNTNDRWSPLNPRPFIETVAYFAPGTIVRAGVVSQDTWLPQITAVVDQWSQTYTEEGSGHSYIDVAGFELLRHLSGIDDNALPGLEGGGETASERFQRLLTASEFHYPLIVDSVAANTMQVRSTDMSSNRLAELYATAESVFSAVRSTRKGEVIVYNQFMESATPDSNYWPLVDFSHNEGTPYLKVGDSEDYSEDYVQVIYDQDTLEVYTDDGHISNDIRFARAEGTQQVAEQWASINRFGRRTAKRTDLVNNSEEDVLEVAKYYSRTHALNTLRVRFGISTSELDDLGYMSMLALDVGNKVDFEHSTQYRPSYIEGYVNDIHHSITPTEYDVSWVTNIGLGTVKVWGIPGAQLPDSTEE